MKTIVTYIHEDSSITTKSYDYAVSVSELDYEFNVDSFQSFTDKSGIIQVIIGKSKR